MCSKSDSVLEPYLDEILKWLQDLNWPGASIILNRLKNYSGEKLKKPFLKCFTKAINLNNEHGLMWLDYLSELLDNKQRIGNLKCANPEGLYLEKVKY